MIKRHELNTIKYYKYINMKKYREKLMQPDCYEILKKKKATIKVVFFFNYIASASKNASLSLNAN